MFRRSLWIILAMILMIGTLGASFADTGIEILNTENTALGYVTVNVNTENEMRATIAKDGQQSMFTLIETANLPLTKGNGQYLVTVYEKVDGRFIERSTKTVDLLLENENLIYLNSVQNVNWNTEMIAIQAAQEITSDLTTDLEKIEAIHTYVVSHVTYDFAKAKNPGGNYLPSIDATLEAGTGICYDYAALYASMLRSVGIPARLTVGHLGSLYHAWNQVYISETDEWMTVDTTNDALYYQYGINYQMFKTSPMYDVEIMY